MTTRHPQRLAMEKASRINNHVATVAGIVAANDFTN